MSDEHEPMSDRSNFNPGYQQVAGRAARRHPARTPGRPLARQIARPMGVPRTAWAPAAAVSEETQGMGHSPAVEDETIPQEIALAFAPLHKRAFGIAMGTACGVVLFLITVVSMLREPGHPSGLHLLNQFFYGYRVTWPGALVGAFWGFVVGFFAGWFIAFCRNIALAISVFIGRTKGELAETADFLDHI